MRRRWLIPEVVQTSAMDCGPAALAALCSGFGVSASYGRLREACQTGVDGTSIDSLEDTANLLGLEAEQVMVPVDYLLEPEVGVLPAIVVTRMPNGFTHFVVVWRTHGPLVQVMDPAVGRRLVSRRRFLADCYRHAVPVSAGMWRVFATAESTTALLRDRLRRVGVGDPDRLLDAALEDPGWRSLAALDAVARMLESRGLRRRRGAAALVDRLLADPASVPQSWWPVVAAPQAPDGGEQVMLRGAVLVRAFGRREPPCPAGTVPGLRLTRSERPPRPAHELARLLRSGGAGRLGMLIAGTALTAAGVIAQAVLLRTVVDQVAAGRLGAGLAAMLLAVAAALLLLELPTATAAFALGRLLENRLRLAFVAKLPRLADHYFRSRPTSDMAERCHSLHRLRLLPEVGGQAGRAAAELVLTAAALAWLDPPSTLAALAAAVGAVAVPLALQPQLAERDLRLRTHQGALGQLTLDALLGVVPLRAHRAGQAITRCHDDLAAQWRRAAVGFQRTATIGDGVQALAAAALVGWLLAGYLPRANQPGETLLFTFWALAIPVLGYDLALTARRWPPLRTVVLRLIEPLGAPEDDVAGQDPPASCPLGGVELGFDAVVVAAGGHEILHRVDLRIPAGTHVALVGPSGAGKSSLLGLVLGWHSPADGIVRVDGEPLTGPRLGRLRRETAWVEPGVQLWNRSLADNLEYGAGVHRPALEQVLAAAGLGGVVSSLADGVATPLGEGGALVSGGEGQRVRLGRALTRPAARLVVLDEPYRGLERPVRARLLAEARRYWRDATLLCATHDVAQTPAFDRVLVIEGGRVVEDGVPADLLADPNSRYRALLDAQESARALFFGRDGWRRWRLDRGGVTEGEPR